uniref:Uncharacterized protein n=1 Tax=Spongospora subterranea TaxID=70186 RepID=A0A0H5RE62_9EUKA|eukprot:CRZ11832.1 hypothetical protein [Spongospora subterranea]
MSTRSVSTTPRARNRTAWAIADALSKFPIPTNKPSASSLERAINILGLDYADLFTDQELVFAYAVMEHEVKDPLSDSKRCCQGTSGFVNSWGCFFKTKISLWHYKSVGS